MAYKIIPGTAQPRHTTAPQAAPAAAPTSSVVARTRSNVRSVLGWVWDKKFPIIGMIAAGVVVHDCSTHGPITRPLRNLSPYNTAVEEHRRRHSADDLGHFPSPVPPIPTASHAETGINETEWAEGRRLLVAADTIDFHDLREAHARGDHSRDAELADRRTTLTRSSLDHFALSLGKRRDETWVQLADRRADLPVARVGDIAWNLWRLGEFSQARELMRIFFRDGSWRNLDHGGRDGFGSPLCNGVELATREEMIPWTEFPAETRSEFRHLCPGITNLRFPRHR